MTVFAVILAGGQGSRLGHVRKGDLRLGGRTLRERVSARLVVDTILPDLPDLPGVGGPLAGLVAAVAHLGAAAEDDILVSVAVDTPFLPKDYVPRLVDALREGAAAFAAYRDEIYPTNAAYRLSALSDLAERSEDIFSPKRLQSMLAATAVDWSALPDDPFANLNTLVDLISLARREE